MFKKDRKNFIQAFLLIIASLITISSFATKRYWVGTGANVNWNATSNWSATSGGTAGVSVPVSTDSVYFDGNGLGQCSINATVSIKMLDVTSAYVDTIKQNTFAITVGTGGMLLSGGTFSGGSATISVGGIFTLSGANFISTTATLLIGGNYTYSSGTFLHNNGTTAFNGVSVTLTGSTTFYDLLFPSSGSGSNINIAVGTTLTSLHLLTKSGGSSANINTGVIDVKGDIVNTNVYASGGGTGTLNICGTGNQTYTGQSSYLGWVCNIKINKPSGILYLKDIISLQGKWEYVSGIVDASTYNSTIYFPNGGGANTIIGKQSLNNIAITTYGGAVNLLSINSGDTLTLTGSLTTAGTGAVGLSGYVNIHGDINIYNTATTYLGSSTGTIFINGTGNQTITGSTTTGQGKLPNIFIDKISGTLTLKNYITIGGNFTYLNGTVDPATYNSTVVFGYSASKTIISGSLSFDNVSFYNNSSTSYNTIPANDTLVVLGDFLLQGPTPSVINTGVVSVKGDIIITNTYAASFDAGTGTILIDGTSSQSFTGTTIGQCRLPNVKIQKTSGTLTLSNTITMHGNWIYVSGIIDATTNNSTVAFSNGSRKISGTHSLNNVSFWAVNNIANDTIPQNDTLTVLGNLYYEGAYAISVSNGTVNIKGDLIITSTHGSTAIGNGRLVFSGNGNQTIQGTQNGTGRLQNVFVNKPSGTVFLKNVVTVGRGQDWKLLSGSVDGLTYNSTLILLSGIHRIQGTQSLYNLYLNADGAVCIDSIYSTDTLKVNGLLKIEGSTLTLYGGTINALGDITVTNTSTGVTYTTGLINICGTGTQTLTGNGISGAGRLCNIRIDKPAGTLNLSSLITVSGSWTYIRGRVIEGTSTVITYGAYTNPTITCVGTSSYMNFYNFIIWGGGAGFSLLGSDFHCTGNLTILSPGIFNGNSKQIYVGGTWDNAGTFTYAGTNVILNGSSRQFITRTSGAVTFDTLTINKPAQKVLLSKPVVVNKKLNLTQGAIGTTSTNLLSFPDNAICTAGSDRSYVCGPMKKTGNDAFTFPLGDTLLSGPYHPLAITAPSVATDAYTAQYYSSNQTYGDSLQVDSLESISNCEYYLLTRNAGSSTVIPTLGWNSNSCNIYGSSDITVAAWNGTQWNKLGKNVITYGAYQGTISAARGLSASALPLLIGVPVNKNPTSECVLKKKLDAGYYNLINGYLKFKFDEEYVNNINELEFNIYDKNRAVVLSDATLGATLPIVNKDNRWSMNVKALNPSLPSGYYVLEVKDKKGEISMLRFKL